MSIQYSDVFVFLLYGDGTIAWSNTTTNEPEDPTKTYLGDSICNRCGPDDQDRVRDMLANVMLDHNMNDFSTIVRTTVGDRVYVSFNRLPIVQPSQHAIVGWCRRLSDEILALTARERDVLKLVCDELTSEQIAKQLHISPTTVESHRQNIARKLGTSSAVGQVRLAIRGGLIEA